MIFKELNFDGSFYVVDARFQDYCVKRSLKICFVVKWMGRISGLDYHFYDLSCKNLNIGISVLISCSSMKCIMMNNATSLYAKEKEPAYDDDEWLHRRNSADEDSEENLLVKNFEESMPTILSMVDFHSPFSCWP